MNQIMAEQQEQPLVVNVRHAAYLLSVSQSQIRVMLKEGHLKSIYIGNAVRVTRASIEALVQTAEAK